MYFFFFCNWDAEQVTQYPSTTTDPAAHSPRGKLTVIRGGLHVPLNYDKM
jgi:hypothetical protein